MSSPTTTASSVIHDIGYRRYTGPRLGRGYATRSLYVHSLRTAFGFGRSAAAKIFPWGILGLLVAIAAIFVAIQSQLPPGTQRVVQYWQYPNQINVLVLLFCAVAAPELVSRDLRGGVLPLYFSRPLTRADYPAAKFAAMVSAVFLLLLVPELVLFLGTAFSVPNMSAVRHEFVLFGQGIFVVVLVALLFSSLAMLVSSLAGNRAVAAALIVGLFILTTPVLGVLQAIAHANDSPEGMTASGEAMSQISFLVSPFTIVLGVGSWLFGDRGEGVDIGPYGPLYLGVTAAVVVVSVLLILLRYRKVAR